MHEYCNSNNMNLQHHLRIDSKNHYIVHHIGNYGKH